MGQNLVLNPSFEDTIPCNQVNYPPSFSCYPWFWSTGGSVDYFSEINQCWAYSAPQSIFGFQYARTGVAYCGLGVYENLPQFYNYREYLGGILLDTLRSGHTYCVSVYVTNGSKSRYFTSNIGVYFSIDSVFDQSTALNLPYIPQIINTNGIIYDTLNWTQISGTYVAGGGEKFITIGNFNDDANTNIDSNTYGFDPTAYFYIDDVSVVDCTVGINEIESYKNKISLMPNPAKDEAIYLNRLEKGQSGVIKVYNSIGLELAEYLLHEGENRVLMNLQKLAQGVYTIVTMIDNKTRDVRKLVVIR